MFSVENIILLSNLLLPEIGSGSSRWRREMLPLHHNSVKNVLAGGRTRIVPLATEYTTVILLRHNLVGNITPRG